MDKECPRCQVVKPLDEFVRNRGARDGRGSYCRPCQKELSRAWRAVPANRVMHAAMVRASRTDPAIRSRDRATSLAWKARNAERVRGQSNSKTKRDKDKQWRSSPAGREAHRQAQQRRRARKLETPSGLSADEWREILDRFNDRCAYCLDENDLEIEHMKPLSLGGAHDKDNVVPACARCNRRKNRRDLLQSLAVVGGMT